MIAAPMAEADKQETPPPESLAWLNMLGWLDTHRRQLGYAGLALLALLFLLYANDHLQKQKRSNADAALFTLSRPPAGSTAPPKTPAAEYLKIATEYRGTPGGERAALLAAGTLFSENKYPEAKTRFDEFITQYPTSPSLVTARLGSAASLDAQNQVDPAIAAYEQLITAYPTSPEASQAKIAVALLYETKGAADKALKYYDELLRANPPSVWGAEATMRREELLKKHPQLTPETKAALTVPSIPTPLLVPPATSNAAPVTNAAPAAKPATNAPAPTAK